MIGIGAVLGFVSNIFAPAADLVDKIHTSDEEKLGMKAQLMQIQASLVAKMQEYETALLEAKSKIITAEANSQSVIARNWRPVTMLCFVASIMGHWFGLTPDTLTPETVDNMFLLVQIGLGGYVVGRSGEKMAKSVAQIIKDK